MAAPQIMDDASSRSRVDWFFKVYILQQAAPTEAKVRLLPNKIPVPASYSTRLQRSYRPIQNRVNGQQGFVALMAHLCRFMVTDCRACLPRPSPIRRFKAEWRAQLGQKCPQG